MSDRGVKRFEMPWRPTFELYSALGWAGSLVSTLGVGAAAAVPSSYTAYMAGLSLAGLAYRGWQTKKHLEFRVALAGTEFFTIPMQDVKEAMEEGQLWMGRGWEWQPMHTQRYYEASKRVVGDMLPPAWYLKLKKIPPYRDVVGAPWIHGLDAEEGDIQLPLTALEGHTGVYGTTGSGKTRFLETLCTQIISDPKNVIIIIDPKGDKELKNIAKEACVRAGRPDAFVMFHPAFPADSIRLDPLKNWTRRTQLASRISMLQSTDGGGDTFQQFAWRTINTVNEGLLYIGIRPNLKSIKKHTESGMDSLMEKVLVRFFEENIDGWESEVTALIAQAKKIEHSLNKTASKELIAYVEFYEKHIPEEVKKREEFIDKMLAQTKHSREHYGKMILNIQPLLDMLTADDLGKMLCPDAEDMSDTRPIFDSGKIIEGGYVLYVGLDSLSDATVGSALAGILLADLAAKTGEIYNYSDKARVHLIVDEAAEAVNDPLIQLLNKGRGAGVICWLLTQTFPDFVAKMGSEAKARQILGNLNNLIALRSVCPVTQKYISEQFGETDISQASMSFSAGSRSEDSGLNQQGSVSQSLSEKTVPLIPPSLLGALPNLHYIARMAGGRAIKGRLPKIL